MEGLGQHTTRKGDISGQRLPNSSSSNNKNNNNKWISQAKKARLPAKSAEFVTQSKAAPSQRVFAPSAEFTIAVTAATEIEANTFRLVFPPPSPSLPAPPGCALVVLTALHSPCNDPASAMAALRNVRRTAGCHIAALIFLGANPVHLTHSQNETWAT